MIVTDYLISELLIYSLWGIMGLSFMAYGVVGGYGMGVSILFPCIAKSEADRSYFYSHIKKPDFFGGCWLFVGLSLIFLVWPVLFLAALSIFRPLILVIIFVIFLRMVLRFLENIQEGDEITETASPLERIRNWLKHILTDPQDNSLRYKILWEKCLSTCSFVAVILFGIILGNMMLGISFHLERINTPDAIWTAIFEGEFFDYFSFFSLACAAISILMMIQQGILGLAINADIRLKERLLVNIHWTTLLLLMIFSLIGLYSSSTVIGYKLLTPLQDLLENPASFATKEVIEARGYWGTNYDLHPWMRMAPAFGYLGLFSTWIYMIMDNIKMAFIANSIAIAGIVGTAGVSIYPFLLPSSTHLSSGLTVWDAPSSSWVLMLIIFCVVLAVPIWVKKMMKFFALEWTKTND